MERVWGVLSHMSAASSAESLSRDRDQFKIVQIENITAVPFVTSNQPVVNMRSDPKDPNAPQHLEFYLPLSPTRAMLFLEKSNPLHAAAQSISIDEAHAYNMIIFGHHGERIFSNSDEYLKHLRHCTTSKE
jgi:Protein of unknown function (DUF4238)